MKIVTLNTWGGRVYEKFVDFINKHQDVDVFCFQEVLKGGGGKTDKEEVKSLYDDIQKVLKDHKGYFFEYGEGGYYSMKSSDLDFKYGIACFVKNDQNSSLIGGIALFDPEKKWNDYEGRFAAGASLAINVSDHVIVNAHGLWQGSTKKDTEARIEQSQRIIDLANNVDGKKIVCGDFNLEPQTESLKMIEKLQTRNLIKDYDVTSTRTSLYKKDLKFADYIFVDKDLEVVDFKVLLDEVSDHSPLYLEFK